SRKSSLVKFLKIRGISLKSLVDRCNREAKLKRQYRESGTEEDKIRLLTLEKAQNDFAEQLKKLPPKISGRWALKNRSHRGPDGKLIKIKKLESPEKEKISQQDLT